MEKILERVKNNIYEYNLIQDKDVIVVGLSGGPDSVFLLTALSELKPIILKEKNISYDIHAAHINHMIREDAKHDEIVARKNANRLNVPFHLLEFDVLNEAKSLKIGTEECGRKIRYEFFENVKKQVNATKIATAHNAGDNAETVVLNFIRGAGISGLSGMNFLSNDLIRPILNISKQDIIEYLNNNNIEFAIDKTNLENDYTRNKIRNDLIKKIELEYNPNIINAINRLAYINKLDEKIIEEAVEEKFNKLNIDFKDDKIYLDTRTFNKYSIGMRYRLVRKILIKLLGNTQNIEMIHIKDTCKLIEENNTKKQYILGKIYKVTIEKKNCAVFEKNINS